MNRKLTTLFEGPNVSISALHSEQQDGDTLISFTGIGHSMGGMNLQRTEFFGAGKMFGNVVFVTDKTRSWGNRLRFKAITRVVSRVSGGNVHCIGNSMGGFLAVVATNYMRIKTCTSIAPQFSVNPEIVPEEKRWKNYTKNLTEYQYKSLSDQFNDETRYTLLTASSGPDLAQTRLFPTAPNIHHLSALNGDHNIAASMKESGLLNEVLRACFFGSITKDLFEKATGSEAIELSGPHLNV